jgi:hypothetical protein
MYVRGYLQGSENGRVVTIANSSIVAILELIRGAQCLIEVIQSSGEEM